MSTLFIAIGVAFLAYGLFTCFTYAAGKFFLIWFFMGGLALAAGLAQRTGAWHALPLWFRRGSAVAAALVAVVLIGACSFIALQARATPPAGADYVIVLGAELRRDGTPKKVLRYRLNAALEYLEENPGTTCVVSGGQGESEVQSEASSMAAYLEEQGLASSRIIEEDRSTNTAENLRFSAELIDDADASVVVATNDFHVCRAVLIAHKQGLPNARGLAAYSEPIYLPQAILRECFALAKDAVVGNL